MEVHQDESRKRRGRVTTGRKSIIGTRSISRLKRVFENEVSTITRELLQKSDDLLSCREFVAPEIAELSRLQRRDQVLGIRLALRMRATMNPLRIQLTIINSIIGKEWSQRKKILIEEDQKIKQLGAQSYLDFKKIKSKPYQSSRSLNRGYRLDRRQQHDDRLCSLQNRITYVLKNLNSKYEELIVSQELQEKQRVEKTGHTKSMFEIKQKCEQQNKNIEIIRPKSAAQIQPVKIAAKTRPSSACHLKELQSELSKLEDEQREYQSFIENTQTYLVKTEGFVIRAAGGQIEVFRDTGGEPHYSAIVPVDSTLTVNRETGFVKSRSVNVPLPTNTKERNYIIKKLKMITTKTGIPLRCTDGSSEEEDQQQEENHHRRRKLLKYLSEYRTPRIRNIPSSSETNINKRKGNQRKRGYLSVEKRKAICLSLSYLSEPLLEILRSVSSEFRSVIQDLDLLSTRRVCCMEALRSQCGLNFKKLPQGVYTIGKQPTDPPPVPNSDYVTASTYTENNEIYVSDMITVSSWEKISKCFPETAQLVTPEDVELLNYNLIIPTRYRNMKLVEKDLKQEWSNEILQLPYKTACLIAISLRATLLSWQQWEAGIRGGVGYSYQWGSSCNPDEFHEEKLAFGWMVPNPKRDKLAECPHSIKMTSISRIRNLPQSSNADPRMVHNKRRVTIVEESSSSPRNMSEKRKVVKRLPGYQLPTEEKKEGEGRYRLLSGGNEWTVYSSPCRKSTPYRKLLDGTITAVAFSKSGWLCLADGSGWIQQTIGGQGWVLLSYEDPHILVQHDYRSTSICNDPPSSCSKLGVTWELSSPVPKCISNPKSAFSSVNYQSALPTPVLYYPQNYFKKEWNCPNQECRLAISNTIPHSGILRSASDLFSENDVNVIDVALGEEFYKSNHRAFSNPASYSMVAEPPVGDQQQRRNNLNSSVDENNITNSGVVGNAIQVRLRGPSLSRDLCESVDISEQLQPTPVRAGFRLMFAITGEQLHPCRPHTLQCHRCKKFYYYSEDCPRCRGFKKLLAKYT